MTKAQEIKSLGVKSLQNNLALLHQNLCCIVGDLRLKGKTNKIPQGPSVRLSLASPQKETFPLSFAKVFMILKGKDKRLVLPLPCPPARQGGAALLLLPPASSQARNKQCQPHKGSTSFGVGKSMAHSGCLFAVRKTHRDEELSQTPIPVLTSAAVHSLTSPVMALVGCRPLSCTAQPCPQLSF